MLVRTSKAAQPLYFDSLKHVLPRDGVVFNEIQLSVLIMMYFIVNVDHDPRNVNEVLEWDLIQSPAILVKVVRGVNVPEESKRNVS